MKKIILKPKVLIVIGILFIAGALGGAVQTFRISQFDSWAVPEGFVIGLSIICVLQLALGTALLRLGLRESLRIQQKL